MIPYQDLCRALDIHNRKLRGEEIPEELDSHAVMDDDFDIVESEDAGMQGVPVDMEGYGEGVPDVTAETAVPQADFGGYGQPGYESGGVPGQPVEGMGAEHYSSGQQAAAYPEGYDPAQQQYQQGYDQAPVQPAGTYPDDQDPNRQR